MKLFSQSKIAPKLWFAVLGALFLSACATAPLQYTEVLGESSPYQHTVELEDTPFFPQDEFQCGPAALATLLHVSGVDEADPDILSEQVYLPERRGSLQMELLGATRRADRVPYVIAPNVESLLIELYAGNPVLILQNLGLPRWPVWHYAVVIGIDPLREEVILRSGTTEREILPLRRFERTWQMSDYWGLVITQPGQIPISADPLRYFEAVAPLEQQQRFEAASMAYEAAIERWPDEATPWIGLGNIAYSREHYADAETYYYQATELAPEYAPVFYNLAWALLRQNKQESARQAAAYAQQLAPEHPRFGQALTAIEQALSE